VTQLNRLKPDTLIKPSVARRLEFNVHSPVSESTLPSSLDKTMTLPTSARLTSTIPGRSSPVTSRTDRTSYPNSSPASSLEPIPLLKQIARSRRTTPLQVDNLLSYPLLLLAANQIRFGTAGLMNQENTSRAHQTTWSFQFVGGDKSAVSAGWVCICRMP